ncbi:hypothetical protein CCZ01_04675 [Helicobacter monodelphidis]|uniref:FxsA family protein n=1 Tax=Helicobacter sp. 15-1451 TaxID=2004995 RepID=UPI000DCC4717|nr:FxsA family protein [Helicobacter sp. 15-1451]RAX57926.1 hypothetical protein CCZ01_04675 [Helicobacter sp. 15-1451]
MFKSLSIIAVLIYLLIETFVSVAFADQVGFFGLFMEILVSFIIGIALLVNFGGLMGHSFQVLRSGRITTKDVATATMLQFLGAIFLLLPGVFLDIIGLIFVILGLFKVGTKPSESQNSHYVHDDDIIDVEVAPK